MSWMTHKVGNAYYIIIYYICHGLLGKKAFGEYIGAWFRFWWVIIGGDCHQAKVVLQEAQREFQELMERTLHRLPTGVVMCRTGFVC